MRTAAFWVGSVASCLFACGPTAMDGDASGVGGADADGSGGLIGSGGSPASGGSSSPGSGGTTGGAASGGAVGSGGTEGESGGTSNTGGSSGAGGAGGAGTGGSEAASGGGSGDGCPFSGHVEYQLNDPESWPSEVVPLITAAMDDAVEHYNCYADLTKSITVNYNPGVPTAEANVDGYLSFGSNQTYMQVATAMHEIGHTLGVSYYPWAELLDNGRWTGPNVNELMQNLPAEERDPDAESQRDYITADGLHFWPYGLNYPEEHLSEWSLINNARVVHAMALDKQAYLDGEL